MTNAPPQPWRSLQRAVREASLNYTSLAERAGISRPYVSAFANGRRRPSAAIIERFAEILNVPVEGLRVDVSLATSPEEMLQEIDGLVAVLDERIQHATAHVQQIKDKRDQLEQLAAGAA
ncbi:helix-turn-helix transcriptional regulator [Streptomyces sp. ID05-26A]|nr:helix-turn-helix transcriptional regulator [Streptomyces sp. ID05-26A]